MKTLPIYLFALSILVLSSFSNTDQKGLAEAEQIQGMYIYAYSKPVAEYKYIGSVKKSISWTGRPKEMLNSMIKKAKKEFPEGDGIIFTDGQMEKADVISFTKE